MRVHLNKLGLMASASFAVVVASTPAKAQQTALTLDEVIVTATKRPEKVRDVAGAVTALTGEQLEAIGAQSFADYLGRQPGVVFNAGASGFSTATIRGVGTSVGMDQGQGPTGYYLDEVPLTEPGYAVGIPDIDTFDLQRVEVLRGPQGTLFGSSSLGGAINYVTQRADADDFDAAAEASYGSTRNTNGDANYTLKGMVNIPIVEGKLAARGVGLYRKDAGYMDNLGTGKKGTNDILVRGGRFSLVWPPSDDTTVAFTGMYQSNNTDDGATRAPALGQFARSTQYPEFFNLSTELYALRLEHDLGFASLTAQASFNRKDHGLRIDYTPYYGFFVPGVSHDFDENGTSDSTTFEARLASPSGQRFEWLVGATHTGVDKVYSEELQAAGAKTVLGAFYPASYLKGDSYYWGHGDTRGEESALFGEASYHFDDQWTLTVGGRLFKTEIEQHVERYGIFWPTGTEFPPNAKQSENGFTPKVSIKYEHNADLMVYALASQGYRFGNLNTIFPLAGFDTPTGWKTDSVWNYEAGVRSTWLDRRLQLDATAFYIDWSDLQVRLLRPDGFSYGANAGKARNLGVEFAGVLRFTDRIDLSANATYLDAKIDETVVVDVTTLTKGQTLPGASKWQVATTLRARLPAPFHPELLLSYRYVSDAPVSLSQPQYRVNGYEQFDVRVNAEINGAGVSLFVNNLTDERGVSFGYGDYGSGVQDHIIRPRTAGVTLSWKLN